MYDDIIWIYSFSGTYLLPIIYHFILYHYISVYVYVRHTRPCTSGDQDLSWVNFLTTRALCVPCGIVPVLSLKATTHARVGVVKGILTYDVGPAGLEPAKPARDAE